MLVDYSMNYLHKYDKNRKFKCLCSKLFESELSLVQHMETECEFIDIFRILRNNMNDSKNHADNSNNYMNDSNIDLNESFEEDSDSSSFDIIQPIKKRRLEMVHKRKKMYTCICGKVYSIKKKLIDHKKNSCVHPKKIYKCVCGKVYDIKKNLIDHKKNSCTNPKTLIYKCVCTKEFVSKKGFACHQRKSCTLIKPKIGCTCKKIYCLC